MDTTVKQLALETLMTSTKVNDDYTQVLRKVEGDVDYEVHVYGNPLHDYWGYQILFHETREDGEYIKSEGYGSEEKERTWDWQKVIVRTQ